MSSPTDARQRWLPGLMALAFVLIWSTGFIVARSIAGRADPNLFLSVRFALVLLVFSAIAAVRRERLPEPWLLRRLFVVGALLQGLYLGPGFWAVGNGLQPGVMALIGALQPPLTAAVAWRLFGERVTATNLLGIALGIVGVALAVAPLLSGASLDASTGQVGGSVGEPAGTLVDGLVGGVGGGTGLVVLLAALVSVSAVTAGTLLQRGAVREVPLAMASAVQCTGGLAVVAILALLLGERRFALDPPTLFALGYAVLVLSVGGFTLLIALVRTGGSTRASSLMFVAPPLAAVMAWWLFGDALAPVQLAGFVVALAGVALARRTA